MRKFAVLLMATVMAGTLVLTGCGGNGNQKETTENKITSGENDDKATDNNTGGNKGDDATTEAGDNGADNKDDVKFEDDGVFTKFDKNYTWDENDKVIKLGDGDVMITEPGTYVLSGTLKDGQVSVNVDSTEKVKLVFNGVDITCKDGAPVYIINADKVAITLAEGTTNKLTDGGNPETSDYKGCIFAKDDLSINGAGKLIVKGTVKNGIHCNNDLAIVSGDIEVSAVDNGIKADDSLSIKNATIKVDANDAIKVSDKDDDTKGTFYMEDGKLTLTATDDGITAAVSLTIKGGKVTIAAIDKATNCDGTEDIKDGCVVTK